MSDWYRWDGDDLLLWIKAQPKSSRDGFAEVLGDAIKLRVTAPPVEGKANKHIVAWLARQFGVAKSAVSIENGDTSRLKRIRIGSPTRIPAPLDTSIRL
jgi:uncharacterized protein (TIGR00251 family)